ncbi:MAG: hypothetical protein LBG83_05135 [Oscillospiraceae bacterium]|jgi:hypothetical protein|nr:hypothetical protein [Oscillospiraceae bacterium]
MNSYQNFSTYNGFLLPGSGGGFYGDNFFVDADGCAWVPCCCDSTGTTTMPPIPIAGEPAGQTGAAQPEQGAEPLTFLPNRGGTFVQVNAPDGILWHPDNAFSLSGTQYQKGMLMDADKGRRYAYQGMHSGRVRLHIAQKNRTTARAAVDGGALRFIDGVFPGAALGYAIGLTAGGKAAAVTVKRQGASVGGRAFAEYLKEPQSAESIALEAGQTKWLFLTKDEAAGHAGVCRFRAVEQPETALGAQEGENALEALLDLEIAGEVTLRCGAFLDFGMVDLEGSMFPMPAGSAAAEPIRAGKPENLTGIAREFWEWEGVFAWNLDDNASGKKRVLKATRSAVPVEILASRDFWPVTEAYVDHLLFCPPLSAPEPVTRDAEGQGLLYHQTFVLYNNGETPRRIHYYVECPGGAVTLALPQANHQVTRMAGGPRLAAVLPNIPPHGKRTIEAYFLFESGDQILQELRAEEG